MGHMINRQSQAFCAIRGIIALATDLIALGVLEEEGGNRPPV